MPRKENPHLSVVASPKRVYTVFDATTREVIAGPFYDPKTANSYKKLSKGMGVVVAHKPGEKPNLQKALNRMYDKTFLNPSTAKQLIDRCRNLYQTYFKKPTKTNLKKLSDFLDEMKQSTADSVKNERKRAMSFVRRESKYFSKKQRNPKKKKKSKKERKRLGTVGRAAVGAGTGALVLGPVGAVAGALGGSMYELKRRGKKKNPGNPIMEKRVKAGEALDVASYYIGGYKPKGSTFKRVLLYRLPVLPSAFRPRVWDSDKESRPIFEQDLWDGDRDTFVYSVAVAKRPFAVKDGPSFKKGAVVAATDHVFEDEDAWEVVWMR